MLHRYSEHIYFLYYKLLLSCETIAEANFEKSFQFLHCVDFTYNILLSTQTNVNSIVFSNLLFFHH